MENQIILESQAGIGVLDSFFESKNIKKLLLVCDDSIYYFELNSYFDQLEDKLGIQVIRFMDFQPNPLYESVVKGVDLLNRNRIKNIIAVGGGSAMDVAKCIKLYSNMNPDISYLEQTIVPNDVELYAIPTTAGTGSEATRYAVIYADGEKQSVSDISCIPSMIYVDPSVLESLPIYQKKATMMDALCHALESFWSVNSTEESKRYSKGAIKMILDNKSKYLENDENSNANMLKAANLAGKAINITQTTAGHAMCYKITSLYGIAHGHAAALCVAKLFPYMVANIDKCIDSRGAEYLSGVFGEIAETMDCSSVDEAVKKYGRLLNELNFPRLQPKEEDYGVLRTSVNPVRLKNNPVRLDTETIDMLYHQILTKDYTEVRDEG